MIWKKSLALALNNIPTPSSLSDFRPVALLCFLSKVLERLIHIQITDYLATWQLFDPYQSVYRKGHSTQSACLNCLMTSERGWIINSKHATILLLFDFSTSSVTVCYGTLFSLRSCVPPVLLVLPLNRLHPTLLARSRQLLKTLIFC